jgi:glutathione S-transferase
MELAANMTMKIYFGPGSCAFAVLVALEQAGVDYDPAKLDMMAGEQRSPAYLSVNPRGRVPALVVGDTVITEAIAVLTYLASSYPAAHILPVADPLLFGKSLELLGWFSSTLHVHLAQVLRGGRYADDAAVIEALKEPGKQRYAASMGELEQKVAESGDFLIGDAFSAVDAYVLVLWRWALRLEIDIAALPLLAAKFARDMERPAVLRALTVEKNGSR